MKKIAFFLLALPLFCSVAFCQPNNALQGALSMQDGQGNHSLIMQDQYFMHAVYNVAGKEFKYSEGGRYAVSGDSLIQHIEFSTLSPQLVGERRAYHLKNDGPAIVLTGKSGEQESWKKVPETTTALTGNWRITGRKDGDSLRQMQRGARKTLKILSGGRFQWAAINPETKEFFGTGGGTYTFDNGKYTEHIEFFSRDSSRVGASLTFKGVVKDDKWHHSGNSSAGKPIYEIWSREKE